MMTWTNLLFVSLLATLLILTVFSGVEGAAVRDDGKAEEPKGSAARVFMPEADASNFLKRRSRRYAKHQGEILAEQRVRLTADERRREYYDEQRSEFENYVEEERDEQNERTREKTEQWREFHYDGLYPRYDHNRHYV
ncbi:upper zone of growth plate and cartilage matrix associated a [Osmerus mordax]|uniref:upper zone of growth plate and cartilage matrix associated a n=1 Tax=Osmerus mordax TaxID=8014 RepID=UPI00350FACFD